ncbi:acyl-CoA thioesterase [Neptunomonas antarctica]|uniref:Acyl-CoA thioester hydrolase n=1 Tax=Neptunomonas antarctica TaxID=619304 RepID=A0A1N7J2E6_9GAMM|nr:thioesterase family protein [Neptunomonas antarctica]SIS43474.1 acyl-CoA thioester hydrolase [Neptunomonas antarctica]
MSTDTGKLIFSCEIPVRWGDMDAYGHVNNAMYMRYMEEARVQLLAKMGATMNGNGIDPVIINTGCTFMRPVVYPDTLRIDCFVSEPGRSSFMTRYEIYSASDTLNPVSNGYSKVVWMDHHTGKSVALPAEIRIQLEN